MIYNMFLLLILAGCSVVCSIQDIKNQSFKVWHIVLSYFLVTNIHLVFYPDVVFMKIVSALIFCVFFLVIRILTKGKLGTGDVLFGAFEGLFLNPTSLPLCTVLSVAAAFLFVVIFTKKKQNKGDGKTDVVGKTHIPFVPFMSFGLLTVFILEIIQNK